MNNDRHPVVAAFGKHPGWDDHIDDIGMESNDLVEIKRNLYRDGIGGNIDAGNWDKLDQTGRLEGFAHVFLWLRPHGPVIGRMWSSVDGKGRSRYPMVLCTQANGVPLLRLLDAGLPLMARLEQQCRDADSAAQVLDILNVGRNQFSHDIDAEHERCIPVSQLAAFVEKIRQQNPKSFYRLIYKMENDMPGFLKKNPQKGASPFPQNLRVPQAGLPPADILLYWSLFMRYFLEAETMIFLTPLQGAWVDILIGAPSTQQFFCLLANSESMPLTTDIPYNLDEAFREQVDQILAKFSRDDDQVGRLLKECSGGSKKILQKWLNPFTKLFQR